MNNLKSENEALLKRLKALEDSGVRGGTDSGSTAEDLVPRASWEVLHSEKLKLEDELKQKEKRLLRLQQVCGTPIPVFLTPYSLFSSLTLPAARRCSPQRALSSGKRLHRSWA